MRAASSASQVVPVSLRDDLVYTLSVNIGRRADQSIFPNGAVRVHSTTSQEPLAIHLISTATVINGAFVTMELQFTPPSSTSTFWSRMEEEENRDSEEATIIERGGKGARGRSKAHVDACTLRKERGTSPSKDR